MASVIPSRNLQKREGNTKISWLLIHSSISHYETKKESSHDVQSLIESEAITNRFCPTTVRKLFLHPFNWSIKQFKIVLYAVTNHPQIEL
jgi:hypothetical protein